MEALFPVLFGLFFVLMIVAAYFANQAAKRRKELLLQLSNELNFEYLPKGLKQAKPSGFWASLASAFEEGPEVSFLHRFEGFSPFGQGHSPDIDNLLVGQRNGLDWYLFDYTYKTTSNNGKTNSTTTHPYGVVAVRVPIVFPGLSMEPETVFHRIGSKLGMKELRFELEEFNRRYFIQCQDPRAAHDILHPQTIEYLMRHPLRSWQLSGYHILIHKPGFYDPLEMRRIVDEVQDFIDLLPEYFRQDRSFAPNWQSPLD